MSAVTTGPSTDMVTVSRKKPGEPEEQIERGLPAGYLGGNQSLGGSQSLAVELERAALDQQIVTARAMPRQITRAVQNITTLATLDDETAEECIYALTRAGKPIKGPSIRLAEIIASQWGNCRIGARVVHVDKFDKYVEAEGVFHDLESNTATTARVRRRISDKKGNIFSEDMIVVTGNAAAAIAKRNAILAGVPHGVWRKAYAMVEQVIAGDVKTLGERRDKALKAFAAFGITPDQVFTALRVAGADDIGLEHLSTLVGMHSALKNNESTVEEMFPKAPPSGPRPKDLGDKLDQLGAGKAEESRTPSAAGPAAATDGDGTRPSPAAAEPPPEGATIRNASSDETAKINTGAEPPPPTAAERKHLREYHRVLAGAISPTGLSKLSASYWKNSPPPEGAAVIEGMKVILGAHGRRVAGDISIADTDNTVREWVAS